MAIAASHTTMRTTLTLRRVTRDFMGNMIAKKRSPAITISVNILAHIAVAEIETRIHYIYIVCEPRSMINIIRV